MQHPGTADPHILKHYFDLIVTVNSDPMSASCRQRYKEALEADLMTLSKSVNELICNGTMCSDIAGSPGSGVRLNESEPVNHNVVFVAVDTAALADAVTVDFVSTTVCCCYGELSFTITPL